MGSVNRAGRSPGLCRGAQLDQRSPDSVRLCYFDP